MDLAAEQPNIVTEEQNPVEREPLRLPALVCSVFLALMASVFLLIFDGNGYTAITTAKRNTFYALTGAFVLALLLTAGLSLRRPEDRAALRKQARRQRFLLIALGAYLLVSLLCALCSPHPEAVWFGASRKEGFLTQACYVAVCASLLLFARPKAWLLWLFGGALLLFSFVAGWQLLGGNPFGLFPAGQDFYNTGKKFLGTVGNVSFTAGLLCIAIPLFAVCLLRGRGVRRFWLLLPLAACCWLAVQIRVLAAFVGLTAGWLLALPFVLRLSGRQTARYFVALLLLGVLGLAALWAFDAKDGLLHELHALLHGEIDDSFGTGRIYIWRQVLARVPQRLWLGYGPDTMMLEQLTPFSRYDESLGRTVYASIDAAHNEYLNILFHQGIFALAAYLGILGCALGQFLRHARRSAGVAACGTAALCYAVQAMFGISQPLTTPFFWIMLGLIPAFAKEENPLSR